MESAGGNSGSLQSSSGGDEEYDDSRAGAALSIFMNTHSPSSHLLYPISPPPPPLFEPVSNYIIRNAASSPNPNSTLWPRPATMRSDPKHAAIFGENNDHLRAARGSRKRSRATRRDPTTVLTTDTTNFKAMVQEFTGIPSPPFSNSTSSSFHLFRTRTTSTRFEPPSLRRPSDPQIVDSPPPPPFPVSSINNFQLPMQLIQSSNLFNHLQNPNTTTLTSLLQYSNPTHDHEFHDFDFNLDGNHCFTALSGLPNLISPDNINSDREINRTAVSGGSNGKETAAPVALKGGGGEESWIITS